MLVLKLAYDRQDHQPHVQRGRFVPTRFDHCLPEMHRKMESDFVIFILSSEHWRAFRKPGFQKPQCSALALRT